jgi:hypothetical protein
MVAKTLLGLFQVGDVGRRRRRRDAQDVIEDKEAALHRRGARGIGGHDQHRAIRQHAAARTAGRQGHRRISGPVTLVPTTLVRP